MFCKYVACVVFGEALQSSRYRRIQRFFSKYPLDYQQIAGFIFKLIESLSEKTGLCGGHFVYLAGLRLVDGALLIVATTELPETAIATYGLRWEQEISF